MSYKLTLGGVIRLSDMAAIPQAPGNRDWDEYLAWVALGNTPQPADPDPGPDAAQLAVSGAKQWYIDNPNAALLFNLSITDLVVEIDSLDLTALPAATRNKLRLLLKTLSVAVRVLAKKQGLA